MDSTLLTLSTLIALTCNPGFTGLGWRVLTLPLVILVSLVLPGGSFFQKRYARCAGKNKTSLTEADSTDCAVYKEDASNVYYILLFGLFIAAFAATLLYTMNVSRLFLPFDSASISKITGRVLYDSSFTKTGRHLMTVVLKSCESSATGQSGTAGGLVTVLGNKKAILTSGIRVELSGSFADGNLFICNNLQVLERSFFNDAREYIITRVERMLMTNGILDSDNMEAEALSMMLLLGRAETYGSKIRALASSCGCLHVLALSGMHLGAVTAVVKPVRNKAVRYILSMILVGAFIFVAGPRPSLIRSGLMAALSFMPLKERFLFCILLQMSLFPLSFANIGLVYAYLAVGALVLVSPHLWGSGLARSGLSVLCFIAPLSILASGSWQTAVIVAGPVASVLAMLSMALGFLLCVFSRVPPVKIHLTKLNRTVYHLMERTFEKCSSLPSYGWGGYAVLVTICAALYYLPKLSKARNRRLAGRYFDSGHALRGPQTTKRPVRICKQGTILPAPEGIKQGSDRLV